MTASEFKKFYQLRLNPQQLAAMEAVEGPVLLLAVPGSGKTTVLVARLGYMIAVCGIAPEQILTMTFTNAAADEMRSRFAARFGAALAQRMDFRTINSLASGIVHHYERVCATTAFPLAEESRQSAILSQIYRELNHDFATESVLKSLKTTITYVKNSLLPDEEIDKLELDGAEFAPIYRAYLQTMREQRLMDFDDQLVYAHRILRQYPEILETYRRRYRYLCVDEAQDTSKIQHAIIALLAQERRNLFMVGDEDQSIYGFRAAWPQALMEFPRTYPGAQVLLMERNYRSTPQIVTAADRFIQRNQNRHPKHMTAVCGDGPAIGEVLVYQRSGQYRYLEKLAAGCNRETAVLYRDNDSALPLIDLFDRAGISYRCRQTDASFFSHRSVRDITDLIRFAQDPRSGELFMSLYYKLGAGISKAAAAAAVRRSAAMETPVLDELCALTDISSWTKRQAAALRTHLANLLSEPADKAIYRIVHFMGYGEFLEQRGADLNKVELLEALGAQAPNPPALLERLGQLELLVRAGGAADSRLILSTIHSSKGLEYERVVLMDAVDGVFPKIPPGDAVTPEDQAALEEERRLFYVGMTRAKRELTVFRFRKSGLATSFVDEILPPKPVPKPAARPIRPAPKPAHPAIPAIPPMQLEQEMERFVPGAEVIHRRFGPGRIVGRTGETVTVQFASDVQKRLSLPVSLPSGALRLRETE